MTNEEVIKELELMRKFNYTLAPMEVFDLAIKALSIVEIIEDTFKRDSNLMMDFNDWKELLDDLER